MAVYDEATGVWTIGIPARVFEQPNHNEALFLMGRAVWKELNKDVPYDCMLNLSSRLDFGRGLRFLDCFVFGK